MVEVSTRWNGERQRRPTGTDLGMEPRPRGPSAPGMADRRLHSKERNAITVNHDVTGGVTNAVTEAVTAMTADRDVTGDVTEAVTDPVTAVTADRDVTGVLRRLLPILLHLLHLLHRFRPY
jgi:hypothetical protein